MSCVSLPSLPAIVTALGCLFGGLQTHPFGPGRSMRGSSSAILSSFASHPPTCSASTILSYAESKLYQRDSRLPASCCVSSEVCGWSVCCPLKHFSCTSTYLRTSQPYHNDLDATILSRAMTLSNTLLEAPSISIFRPASYKAFPFEPLPFSSHTRVLQTSTSFVQ
jgi:hypothetical protein